ncbi:MAG TPA: cobalt-precorrin-5B (C(1))-methyltransferase [Thermohalobaculum sp.]|nr:cobalt-precorrin-5B (C(1))-methyltransferase [Thermohalobaculum sp.]
MSDEPSDEPLDKPTGKLRSGWTTGACATAAAKAAAEALLGGGFPGHVRITLPRGQTPTFEIAETAAGPGWAEAAVVKDAGDDPDVTHLATIRSRVAHGPPGSGIRFRAGPGVGTVTRPGLAIPVGEPAINPVPREMIQGVLREAAEAQDVPADFEVTVAVDNGVELARRTWNPRLGIEGGLSILGTTGIVRPFSCSAWIASIHRGIDVARASGLAHVVGATGSTSESAVRRLYDLPDIGFLDMGDFAGGTLKYLRRHPVPRLTLAGGIGKMTKLAQGALDLHSGRSQVDFERLAALGARLGADPARIAAANTAAEALEIAGPALAEAVAEDARAIALEALRGAPVGVEVIVTDRRGTVLGRTGFVP